MAHYEELSPILNGVVGGRFLRDKKLCKLLYDYIPNDDASEDYTLYENNPNALFMTHIYPLPKMPDAKTEKKCYLCAYFNGGYEVDDNTGYRNVLLLVDIICHLDVWFDDDGYRVYDIMAEIDKLLNGKFTDLPIEGTPYLRGFQTRVYSDYFYGVQLMYNLKVNSTVECNKSTISSLIRSGGVYDPTNG